MTQRRPASLCILTCDQIDAVDRLVASIRRFEDLDVEIVIGDNSRKGLSAALFSFLADRYETISDEQLWYDGFGACKQRLVNAASNDWVIIADPDEEWEPLEPGAVLFDQAPLLRVCMTGVDDMTWGRVFDRRQFRLLGTIHEEAYHRKTRETWSHYAADEPFAVMTHHADEEDASYRSRKLALYENLLHRAYTNDARRSGTHVSWFTEYWPKRLAEGWNGEMTFEEWCRL